ncbi:hypothetical protein UlMin_004186 [Ulmus minor]
MRISNIFYGSFETLKEAYKIFSRNGKQVPFIALIYLCLGSIIFWSNVFSIKPLLTDYVTKLTDLMIGSSTPDTSGYTNPIFLMLDDFRIFVGVEWIFTVLNSLTLLLFSVATILASAAMHNEKELDLKSLLVKIVKTWRRTFVTLFYTTLLDSGYAFFVLALLLPLFLIFGPEFITMFPFSYLTFTLASVFQLYLSIVWTLAFVVSTLEEKSGIEALGKAGQLVKGLKLKGFFLKFAFGLLCFVMFKLLMMMINKQTTSVSIAYVFVFFNMVSLIKMFSFIVFTVFYFECKKKNGQEVELQGGDVEFEYTKIPTNASHPAADIP